jgi:hypothetical protein
MTRRHFLERTGLGSLAALGACSLPAAIGAGIKPELFKNGDAIIETVAKL